MLLSVVLCISQDGLERPTAALQHCQSARFSMVFPRQFTILTDNGSNLTSTLRYKPFPVGSFKTNSPA